MAAARILDGEGFIQSVVNNYSRISFNFGATLFTWMQRMAPEIYDAIRAADDESVARFSGHGNAVAQAYNHIIMPLANERDKRTQVVWGIRDFEERFARRPEGMWLPETAVDVASLEALAEQGIAYTILAPHQAKRVRPLGDDEAEWEDVDQESLDKTQPYLAKLPSGRSIALFFYDGPLSRAVAFERLVSDGDEFARRLVEAAGEEREEPRLAHIATDGETYGHHHRFAEMGLAYALEAIESRELALLTNYGEYLEKHPPTMEAEIVEMTAWSCAHGVERWRSNCGCNSGGHDGWNQEWRTPLREALNWLRDQLIQRFESQAGHLLKDPWAARDAYIELVLDRSQARAETWLQEHASRPLDEAERTRALKLLEMQRQAMLMFASCAWFYDDVSGIETQQAMRHAARAIQLAQELNEDGIEARFVEMLSQAQSNLPEQGSGADVYRRYVEPITIDLPKLAAHYAVSCLFHTYDEDAEIGEYRVHRDDIRVLESGRTDLIVGRGRASSSITYESTPFYFAVLHLGEQTVTGGLNLSDDVAAYERLAAEAASLYEQGDFAAMIRFLDERFTDKALSLQSLFRDQQRRAIRVILDPVLEEAEDSYRRIYEGRMSLIHFLKTMGFPLPHRLALAADVALDLELGRALGEESFDAKRARKVLDEAELAGVSFESERLALLMQQTLQRFAADLESAPESEEALDRLHAAIELLQELPFSVDLGSVQNAFFRTVQNLGDESGERRSKLDAIGAALKVRVGQTPARNPEAG
jgi:alpha-amylase/alpha-mannosidase (GH57 family)